MTLQRGPATAVFVSPYDDELEILQPALEAHHRRLELAKTRTQATPLLNTPHCGIILIDSDLPGGWKIFLQDVQARAHPPALIVVARVGDERLWAEVVNLGGYDVLAKPLDPAEVDYVISAACRQIGGGPITPDAMPVSQCWALEIRSRPS